MQKIIVIAISTTFLLGCVTPLNPIDKPYEGINQSFNIDDKEATYAASIDCAMQYITSPLSGQFFTFQSDKLSKWVVTYQSSDISAGNTLGSPSFYKVRSSLNFGIKNNTVTLSVKNVTIAYTGTLYGVAQGIPKYSKPYTQDQVVPLNASLQPMLDSMVSCVKENINSK